jgi:hypothetical protein
MPKPDKETDWSHRLPAVDMTQLHCVWPASRTPIPRHNEQSHRFACRPLTPTGWRSAASRIPQRQRSSTAASHVSIMTRQISNSTTHNQVITRTHPKGLRSAAGRRQQQQRSSRAASQRQAWVAVHATATQSRQTATHGPATHP